MEFASILEGWMLTNVYALISKLFSWNWGKLFDNRSLFCFHKKTFRPRLTTRFSFPNLRLEEFQAWNEITESKLCLRVKIELMKLGFGGTQTL